MDSENKSFDSKNGTVTIKLSTLILAVGLTVAVVLMVVFAVLYFSSLSKEKDALTETITQPTVQVTKATDAPTQAPTQAETKAPKKKKKPKATTAPTEGFDSYHVTLYYGTNIYAGPGYNYEYVMTLYEQGVYTIVDECYDTRNRVMWGKLKSGVGWVNLNEEPYDSKTYVPPKTKESFQSYLVTLPAQTPIYAGPSYSYDMVMSLDEQGVFTIVEESYDSGSGMYWGKLKSGVGWIDLSWAIG